MAKSSNLKFELDLHENQFTILYNNDNTPIEKMSYFCFDDDYYDLYLNDNDEDLHCSLYDFFKDLHSSNEYEDSVQEAECLRIIAMLQEHENSNIYNAIYQGYNKFKEYLKSIGYSLYDITLNPNIYKNIYEKTHITLYQHLQLFYYKYIIKMRYLLQ